MELEAWLLCAALAAAALAYYTARRRGSGAAGRLPPGPTPLPVVGNVLSLRGNMHHALARLAREHGPVMTLRLGLVTAVVVSSPGAAREAFARHDRRLAARAVPDIARARGFAGRSMIWLPSSDPLWKTLRGVAATHVFSPRSLAAACGVRERKVRDIVGYFAGRAGEEVDVGRVVYGGVINLVSSTLFSADVVDVGAASAHGLQEAVEDLVSAIARPNVSDLLPFLQPLDLQRWRPWMEERFDKIFAILNGIINRRLADAGTSTGKHGDFLDSLLELTSTGKIARDNVSTIMFDVFGAGTDTISITVEWAMAELLRNPSIMAKARAEMEGVLAGKNAVEETDMERLPYLRAVVKEAMRLHPVAPIMLPHRAVEDGVEIAGYAVPKGSTVIFNVWAIMRDPAEWEKPEEFMPERFLDPHRAEKKVEFRGKDF